MELLQYISASLVQTESKMEELGGNTHVANRGARMKSNHPTYVVMVKEAIQALRERNGSSRQKITKYIM